MSNPDVLKGLRAIAAYARNAPLKSSANNISILSRADRVKDAIGAKQEIGNNPKFSSVLSARMDQLDNSVKRAETVSAKAMLHQTSSIDMITAIAETETLVLQVREMHQRIITSLQELFKTPI